MIDALYIGATGMQSQQLNVDTIANNLANVNTPAFKKGRVSFTDLMMSVAAQVQAPNGADGAASGLFSVRPWTGAGVGVAGVSKMFDAGDIKQTGSAHDLAIRGDGFFEVAMPDGSRAFTRGGTFKVDSNGAIVTQAGYALKPGITLPSNATNIIVARDGSVSATLPDQATPVDCGRLELVRFSNPAALLAQGDNLYRASELSGEPMAGIAGLDGAGTLEQGFVEGSNVKMVDEILNLMIAQRAYEASVKVVQASDDMLGMINNLRK